MNLFQTSNRIVPTVCALALTLLLALSGCKSSGGGSSAGVAPKPKCTPGSVVNPSGGPGDPLELDQWFLNNTGQSAYASGTGSAGEDIFRTGAAPAEIGAGVRVAVVDTGLEIGHEDLSPRVPAGGSYNFGNGSTNPTNPDCYGDHGTSVGGLIGAEANNGLGGRGVAPGVDLVGFNFLGFQGGGNQQAALGGATFSSSVRVFNQSYGTSNNDDFLISPTLEGQLITGTEAGKVYVKSAGNGFGGFGDANCGDATAVGITCQNANMDPSNAVPWNIVVGALNADGERSTYSTAGSALWISAPGGEYGYDSGLGWTGPAYGFEPAMVTTDQSGCSKGYSRNTGGTPHNPFEYGHTNNQDCNYTSTFNGTSSAAPVLSGVIALMLEANPALTWRDVKYILAATADNTLPITNLLDGTGTPLNFGPYVAEPDWVNNGSLDGNLTGLRFHNWYGFGAVDALAAVNMARGYSADTWPALDNTNPLWDQAQVPSAGTSIPDNSSTGQSDTITLSGTGFSFVEAVQIKVNITHTYTGDLGIELTSPAATRSVLFTTRNGFAATDNLSGMVLLSNAFYGEVVDGGWTIKVVDTFAGDAGTLNNWQIRVYGH